MELLARRDLLAGFEERRCDLVTLRPGFESQEATLCATMRGQFPKITLGLGAVETSYQTSLGQGSVDALI